MIVTIEISLYPIRDDFEAPILEFIEGLRAYSEITTYTNAMSTYIKGDWNTVMDILKIELGKIYPKLDTSSTVLKIINRDLPVEEGIYS